MKTNLKDEFIPYEQALDFKKLGFDEECFAFWNHINGLQISTVTNTNSSWKDDYGIFMSAPLYQQAFKWFRKKHNLEAYSIPKSKMKEGWFQWVINGYDYHEGFKTYEEAEIDCFKKLIEIVKTSKKS